MPISVRISVNTAPLAKFRASLTPGSPIMRNLFDGVIRVYAAFTRRRFVAASRGVGMWPPLSAATLRARRRGRGSGSPAILRDTGMLFNALAIGGVGNITRVTGRGAVYGYASINHPRPIRVFRVSRHPKRGRRTVGRAIAGLAMGAATLREIAVFHQTGAGRLPRRQIFVQPDSQTKRQMDMVVRRAVTQAGEAAQGAGRPSP